jgi:hypothetical protein
VVAAPLEAHGFSICSYTVRPRGHPFDRFLRLSSSFGKELVQKKGSYFLIIDEGPGLSGSSMTSVAEKLSGLGIADDRILFFPSWEPDGSRFRSEAARGRWPRHRKIATSFEEIFLNREKYFSSLPQGPFVDFSGGRWRSHVYQSELSYPPVSLNMSGGSICRSNQKRNRACSSSPASDVMAGRNANARSDWPAPGGARRWSVSRTAFS